MIMLRQCLDQPQHPAQLPMTLTQLKNLLIHLWQDLLLQTQASDHIQSEGFVLSVQPPEQRPLYFRLQGSFLVQKGFTDTAQLCHMPLLNKGQ